jgi:hypothetical protein
MSERVVVTTFRTENAHLRIVKRRLEKRIDELEKIIDRQRVERLHHAEEDYAEIKRLREALEKIASGGGPDEGVLVIARQALEGSDGQD